MTKVARYAPGERFRERNDMQFNSSEISVMLGNAMQEVNEEEQQLQKGVE